MCCVMTSVLSSGTRTYLTYKKTNCMHKTFSRASEKHCKKIKNTVGSILLFFRNCFINYLKLSAIHVPPSLNCASLFLNMYARVCKSARVYLFPSFLPGYLIFFQGSQFNNYDKVCDVG